MNRYERVRQWARDRNLIEGSTPAKQYLKLIEELGEVAGALARGNRDALMDGIGDVAVVLIIMAEMKGLDLEGDRIPIYFANIHFSNLSRTVVAGTTAESMALLEAFSVYKGLDFNECLDRAWDDIKDRKGKMIFGVFVKEDDLPETGKGEA